MYLIYIDDWCTTNVHNIHRCLVCKLNILYTHTLIYMYTCKVLWIRSASTVGANIRFNLSCIYIIGFYIVFYIRHSKPYRIYLVYISLASIQYSIYGLLYIILYTVFKAIPYDEDMALYSCIHTEEAILNISNSSQIWILFTLFLLILHQTEWRLVLNLSHRKSVITIQIWLELTRFRIDSSVFIFVYIYIFHTDIYIFIYECKYTSICYMPIS